MVQGWTLRVVKMKNVGQWERSSTEGGENESACLWVG